MATVSRQCINFIPGWTIYPRKCNQPLQNEVCVMLNLYEIIDLYQSHHLFYNALMNLWIELCCKRLLREDYFSTSELSVFVHFLSCTWLHYFWRVANDAGSLIIFLQEEGNCSCMQLWTIAAINHNFLHFRLHATKLNLISTWSAPKLTLKHTH